MEREYLHLYSTIIADLVSALNKKPNQTKKKIKKEGP